MANRWRNNGNNFFHCFQIKQTLFSWAPITANGDCSHEIKKCLLLGRKAVTNLDSILKSRDIILLTEVHLVKVMVFPIVMLDQKEG